MKSIQNIRRRIESIKKTKQITNSMRLVASSKIQQSRVNMENNIDYFNASMSLMDFVAQSFTAKSSKYFNNEFSDSSAIIVISTDRGLCGAYNTNIAITTVNLVKDQNSTVMITIGNKIIPSLEQENIPVDISYLGISEVPLYEEAEMIGNKALELYEDGLADSIYVVYTEFKSMLEQEAKYIKLLPYPIPDLKGFRTDMESEPHLDKFIQDAIPSYISSAIFYALVHSAASEQASRVTSMDAASKNSDDIIQNLTMEYNKARQANITQEISEIVSGSNMY